MRSKINTGAGIPAQLSPKNPYFGKKGKGHTISHCPFFFFFTGQDIEEQREKMICPRSHSYEEQRQNPQDPDPVPCPRSACLPPSHCAEGLAAAHAPRQGERQLASTRRATARLPPPHDPAGAVENHASRVHLGMVSPTSTSFHVFIHFLCVWVGG